MVKMAKPSVISVSAPLGPAFTCGLCASAYGFCLKGHDGKPICCRCSHDGAFLKMCDEKACGRFEAGRRDLPDDFSFGISPMKEKECAL